MMNDKYLENLKSEFIKNKYDEIEEWNFNQQLSALYSYYHYYNADSSKIDELIYGLINDENFNNIVAIYRDFDADEYTVDILLSYDLSDVFNVGEACFQFKDVENRMFSLYDSKAQSVLKKKLNDLSCILSKDTNHIRLKMLVDYIPKTAAVKKSIQNGLKITKPAHKNVEYSFVFWDKIENNILEIEDPKEFVTEASIKIDRSDNLTLYGPEGSFICNISAFDLKSIYEQYSYRGLFAQNLRYYVDNPKIDDNIVYSMQAKPDYFWYLNNGIIIICDKCDINGSQLTLHNFSIINGGQTTFLIGENEFQKDFFVQCKIVINKFNDEASRLDFISNVAEATNTQKPIKPKDLVANRPEQRKLKKQLADARIFCSIKRGQKVNKKLYSESWQNTNNEELAQILYAFMYQNPGTAKGGKSSLCGNEEKYSLIFGKVYNTELLKDLLVIKGLFKKWSKDTVKKIEKNKTQNSEQIIAITKYGYYYVLSIIGLILKFIYHPFYSREYDVVTITDQKRESISQYDISHKILKNKFDAKDIYYVFDEISEVFIESFNKFVEIKKEISQSTQYISNFVKSDSNYHSFVVSNVVSYLEKNIYTIKEKFYIPNDEEKNIDELLLRKYRNPLVAELKDRTKLPDDVYELLYGKLKEFRTNTFRRNHIKAYEICKDNALKLMASYGPTTIDDLISLRCMDEYQIEKYGEDFIEIISNILSY